MVGKGENLSERQAIKGLNLASQNFGILSIRGHKVMLLSCSLCNTVATR